MNRGGIAVYHWIPKLPIDDSIPLISIFVLFYLFAYIYWFITFLLASRTHKPDFYNFLISIIISMLVGFVLFISIPTYMDRSIEPSIVAIKDKPGFLYDLIRLIYSTDGGSIGYCLFPSYHCLLACSGFFGIFRKKEFHIGTRIIYFVLLLLICSSTIFIKQHYIVDVFVGIAIPCVVYLLVKLFNPGSKIYLRQIKRIKSKE